MKIVGIGLNKTGTKTLGACLRHWKMRHVSFSAKSFELWRANSTAALLEQVAKFDSFEDWPWPLLYREIDAAFSGSKFLLTRRRDPDTWFTSLCKHAERTGPTIYRKAIYGYEMPQQNRDAHIRYYENHLISVREFFRDRPNALLELCWEEGHGWRELASFIGLKEPAIPFPHENRSP